MTTKEFAKQLAGFVARGDFESEDALCKAAGIAPLDLEALLLGYASPTGSTLTKLASALNVSVLILLDPGTRELQVAQELLCTLFFKTCTTNDGKYEMPGDPFWAKVEGYLVKQGIVKNGVVLLPKKKRRRRKDAGRPDSDSDEG